MTVNRSPNSLAATSQPSSEFFRQDRKSTRLNSSHSQISYAVFCLKKKKMFPHIVSLRTDSWVRGSRSSALRTPHVFTYRHLFGRLSIVYSSSHAQPFRLEPLTSVC